MKDVIAIGSTVRDAFFETDFEIAKWPKSPSGKAIIIPYGEKFGAKNVHFKTGGNATNASVTFARQKIGTNIFTRIGKDVAGGEIRRTWKKEGVKYGLVTYSDLPTAYSVLLLQEGERSIITYHGAIDEFTLKGTDLRKLKSKWWYISLPGESYKAFGPLLKYARENNIKVALNPSYIHLTGDGLKDLIKHLKDVTVLFVNRSEASSITGIPVSKEREVFKKLDDMVYGISVITDGSKGVKVSDGKYIYSAGVFKNKKIIDRTGAGDAFGAGFVSGLIRKKEKFDDGVCKPENIEYAMRLGSANGTSVVEFMGSTDGILTKYQFDTLPRFKKLPIIRKEIKK